MHEIGTLRYVLDTVDSIIEEQKLSSVEKVTLEVGEVSGILPEFLYKCWDFVASRSKYACHAALEVETLPAITICLDCHGTYPTVKYGKTCPYCGSSHTVLLKGNEYNIKEIAAV